MLAGVACVRATTKIWTENGLEEIQHLKAGTKVFSLQDGKTVLTECEAPFVKGKARLYRVTHEGGEFVAHGRHLVYDALGRCEFVQDLSSASEIISPCSIQPRSIQASSQPASLSGESHLTQKSEGSPIGYPECTHSNDPQPQHDSAPCLKKAPSQGDEQERARSSAHKDARAKARTCTHLCKSHDHQKNADSSHPSEALVEASAGSHVASALGHTSQDTQQGARFQSKSDCHHIDSESILYRNFSVGALELTYSKSGIKKIELLKEEEEFWDVHIPGTEVYFAEGAIHHNSGKSYTGSQFAILNFLCHPDKTGLIAANSYDQLSQATLRELFYWLDKYGLPYVVDRLPPKDWGVPKTLKTYRNVLSVKIGPGQVATAFIRVLSDPDTLRGIEISWYWLDESRDTEQYAHDMILSRLRESTYVKGLITTTPNGEDWVYKRFCKDAARANDWMYGSLHCKTYEAVKAGLITKEYYDTMRRTYSPLMALQELDAAHVNVWGGRAYYAEGAHNRAHKAPWGDYYPDPSRPLIVGCDFNFSPAPMVWVVGQIGPPPYDEHIHWFQEIANTEISTRDQTKVLLNQFPGFFYRVFGDASGRRGTTSNAGEHDYNQMTDEMDQVGAMYTVDVDPANPLVKDRVENVNARCKNSLGETFMTYDPDRCPLLAGDLKMVGWKKIVSGARPQGKLDDGGDHQRTHAGDAVGYPLFKLFPPGRRFSIIEGVSSGIRQEFGLLGD